MFRLSSVKLADSFLSERLPSQLRSVLAHFLASQRCPEWSFSIRRYVRSAAIAAVFPLCGCSWLQLSDDFVLAEPVLNFYQRSPNDESIQGSNRKQPKGYLSNKNFYLPSIPTTRQEREEKWQRLRRCRLYKSFFTKSARCRLLS